MPRGIFMFKGSTFYCAYLFAKCQVNEEIPFIINN
jgi:hypothetical protein